MLSETNLAKTNMVQMFVGGSYYFINPRYFLI
nr:MAG TPA: hypothetical protein [Caudoviricetes sp.]